MSSIDLVILGMVLERPQSAYDIQKDVEYHNLSRWTQISTPSVYRKVIQLQEMGYLQSEVVKGARMSEKTVYSLTESGKEYFHELMAFYAAQPVPLLFDFNVVISNLNKVPREQALALIAALRAALKASAKASESCAAEYAQIPLVGRTIFEQQRLLYGSLLEWLDHFEGQFEQE